MDFDHFFAAMFISAINFFSEPEIASPSAVAASLAERIADALIRYLIDTFWPGLYQNFDGGSDAAFLLIETY